jgi:dihydrofolate synthase/folylpolyglutamate synthase
MSPRERLFALEQFGIKLGLDNITAIVAALGRPDRHFRSVHVAGTNGKGSVTAMVERGLRAAGERTGRYISPHLVDIEERIAIDGVPIDSETFDTVAARVMSVIDDLRRTGALPHWPTFFDATTAIAFEIFRRRKVGAAAIEVGLGGRFDSTNVIEPVVCAITSIDLDHERHLGRTLREIAFEKAGIIKPMVPVVLGRMSPEARAVIVDVARGRQAPCVEASPADGGEAVTLALHGAHQHDNAAVAVATLQRFGVVDRTAIVSALTEVEWPARLEWLRVPAGGDLLLDAAHNPAGARALAEYVTSTVGALPLVLGVMRDKDVDAIVRALTPAVSRFVATAVDSPRALPARDLAGRILAALPGVACEWHDEVGAALAAVCHPGGQAMVAGSIFLVGPVRAQLLARGAVPVRYPAKAGPFFLSR